MAPRRCLVCGAAHASCGTSDPATRAVDVIEERTKPMGKLKRYDVSGKDLTGDGRPAAAGTILKLSDADAERLGLKAAPKKEAEAKPVTADAVKTAKRSAPARKRK